MHRSAAGRRSNTGGNRLAEDGATATEIQALLGHESLNTSQGYIDATANATRQAARANRTYGSLRQLLQADQRHRRSGPRSRPFPHAVSPLVTEV